MNVNCTICSDQLVPTADIYATQCGHVFHYACLIQWIERSKTCPQCRFKATEKTIHRIYFTVTNSDFIKDDVVTLQGKVDNLQYELKLKNKDVAIHVERYKEMKTRSVLLRQELTELEHKTKSHESVVLALKDRIALLKSKAKEVERLTDENLLLKNKIKRNENVQIALNGTREEVNEMLRHEHDIKSLVTLVGTLKRTLVETERRKKELDYKYRQAQVDSNRYRKENATLEASNNVMKRDIELMTNEKEYLKTKLTELNDRLTEKGQSRTPNTSVQRILQESPAPLPFSFKVPTLEKRDVVDLTSPRRSSQPEKTSNEVIDSASTPYLPVKSSIGTGYSSIFKQTLKRKIDIIPTPRTTMPSHYNGLGGHSNEDFFPISNSASAGPKRQKSTSAIPSSKFKKLAPGPSIKKYL